MSQMMHSDRIIGNLGALNRLKVLSILLLEWSPKLRYKNVHTRPNNFVITVGKNNFASLHTAKLGPKYQKLQSNKKRTNSMCLETGVHWSPAWISKLLYLEVNKWETGLIFEL